MTLLSERLRNEGMEKGLKQGIQQGLQQGRLEGRLEGMQALEVVRKQLSELLLQQLNRRFGGVPPAVAAQVETADAQTLTRWLARTPEASSLNDALDG